MIAGSPARSGATWSFVATARSPRPPNPCLRVASRGRVAERPEICLPATGLPLGFAGDRAHAASFVGVRKGDERDESGRAGDFDPAPHQRVLLMAVVRPAGWPMRAVACSSGTITSRAAIVCKSDSCATTTALAACHAPVSCRAGTMFRARLQTDDETR